jgi:TolB-like protein/class 3 adenylate cyclase/Tfp pilus assembly protein PilF
MSSELKPHLHLEVGHILFLDIVGFSRLLADEQKELVQELNQIVRETKQFQAAEAEGKLTRLPTGDGMVLVFTNDPEAPVECALEISQKLQSRPQLKLRMGIHSGPVNPFADVNDQSNLAGAGINVAQRVVGCGDAGHILLSKHFAEDLEHYVQWRSHLHDIGRVEVKHGARISVVNFYTDQLGNSALPAPIRRARASVRLKSAAVAALLLITALGVGFWMLRRSQEKLINAVAAIPSKSIAVLPFENRSQDADNAYFADGIQDEILTRLSNIADLKVISRTSTQHYKSAPENLPEIAKQLGVAHILEGSVQKSGDAVRVNVQLIKAANDSHLWADTFDRKLTDIFSVESDIAKAVADQLRAKLTGQEEGVIVAKPTDNVEAYDAYLRGLAYTLKAATTTTSILGAQKYLREAVRLDPKFALSWALLSYVDAVGYLSFKLQPTPALREQAGRAAEVALMLQPNLGEALLAKGYFHYACLKDYDTAVRYFEEARRFLPNSSRIPESLAYVARRRGQWDQSDYYFQEAERLDPRNANLLTQHALSDVQRRRFPEALRKLDKVLDISPGDIDTFALKAAIAQAEGDLPRAAALLAPLQPTAEISSALETQVYQAILERHPAEIIPRLKEILTKPDPALGYINGELRFWLGWAQEVGGDRCAAQESWQQARAELEAFLKEQPDNYLLIGDLALTMAGLGDTADAFALSERAKAAIPIEKDAIESPIPTEILGRVAAYVRDRDRAIASLEKILLIPYDGALASGVPLTPALLRLDPMFDGLRNDPRFQKLTASEAPKQ